VAEGRGDRRHEEGEGHERAVERERAVIEVVGGQRDGLAVEGVGELDAAEDGPGFRGEEVGSEDEREDASEEEGEERADEVHDADALVVDRVDPAVDGLPEGVLPGEVRPLAVLVAVRVGVPGDRRVRDAGHGVSPLAAVMAAVNGGLLIQSAVEASASSRVTGRAASGCGASASRPASSSSIICWSASSPWAESDAM